METSIGGGLPGCWLNEQHDRWKCVRPGAVDAHDAAWKETIGVGVVDVGDVPPNFSDPCEGRGEER